MKTATLEHVITGEKASFYSICIDGNELSEFAKFMQKFDKNEQLSVDYNIIMRVLINLAKRGVAERNFRPEGKMNDGVCAIPLDKSKLRLYCLRLSERVLIIGNGGIKDCKTYNENEVLNGYVSDLQQFEKALKKGIKDGYITIQDEVIIGFENKNFEL